MKNRYSIVIPAYNEEGAIGEVLKELLAGPLKDHAEIIVVNDNSSDNTAKEAQRFPVRVFTNIQNFGYGYSLKRGISEAKEEHIIILDADGSYPVSAIATLVAEYERGFDMVVGARRGVHYRGRRIKQIGRFFFRILSEFTTGRKIPDINSGCRVFRRDLCMRFFHTLSSGFSFTTTITLAFMLNSYSVKYIPIEYLKRQGSSKVHYIRDTLRSLQIIVEAIVHYNPLKLYILCAAVVFLAGILSMVIALFAPIFALIFFLTIAFCMTLMALGFLGIIMKFMHTTPR